MKTNRRDFIKIASAGTGGLLLATPSFNFFKDNEEPIDDTKVKRYPTYCEICFWQCAGWTYVKENGDIWKVVGNKDDQHSIGRFCPRGTGGVGTYYDPDRLKTPLLRVKGAGEDGKDSFKEVSWDEALDYVAQKMDEIAEKHGPDAVALLTHGSGGSYFKPLLNAFGSPNIAKPSYAQCRGPREVGFQTTFGSNIGSPEPTDIKNTRCLVLIGSHLGENMHNAQVQEMAEAIDNGATFITVDPRFSTVASKSKYWLPIKPATDIALLLSWMHVLINNEWYNKEYVAKHTIGFDQLKAYVAPFTPQWAYGITDIKPEIIIETAREMSEAKPSVIIHPGRHVTWYGDDSQRSRAIAMLNALLGSWGAKGGYFIPEGIGIPQMPPAAPHPHSEHDINNGLYPLAGDILANKIVDASIAKNENDWRIRGWIINGTNPLVTMPNQENTKNAIDALDLLVVIDTMPAEIVSYADVVLPECTYLERYDTLRSSSFRYPSIALRMPAAKPMYKTKSAAWMAKELSKRLGLQQYFPWKNEVALLDWQLKQMGSSLEEMKKIGVKNFDRNTDMYPVMDETYEFGTPSGKIELFSASLAEMGFDPMPKYTAHPEPEAGYYRLNYGRAPMHTFGRTVNSPNLNDLMPENVLWVNPKVLKDWSLKNGDEIWLENQAGVVSEFPIKIRATERIRYDNVYMVHGFGANQKQLSKAYGRGINDQQLISTVMVDPLMGGTGFRGNFVTFLTSKPEKEAKA